MKTSSTKTISKLSEAIKDRTLSKQEYIRIQAVLLNKKGYALKKIVDITQKSEDAIENWITAYNKNGLKSLRTKPQTGIHNSKLTNEQKDSIKKLIINHSPSEYKYNGDFWSVPLLKQLIKDTYNVTYKTAKAYRDLFNYCGFSYQKAEYIDHRKDSGQTEHFKKRFEKKLKKGAISMWW